MIPWWGWLIISVLSVGFVTFLSLFIWFVVAFARSWKW
jgi:hypothetical protein